MGSPKGQHGMIPTPRQPTRRYGLGAAHWHPGETLVITRPHKRRRELAELLQALLNRHPDKIVYVAWNNASPHADEQVQAVLQGAPGRLVLLYLPTYSPWLNPIEMLWRQFRREVTRCELVDTAPDLLTATNAFFERRNRRPDTVRTIIGAHPTGGPTLYLVV